MDIKNLILICGGLLIAAVVAHGLWIAWRARRDPLRLKIDEKLIAAVADRDPVQADFPNGGARVVTRWDEPVHQSDRDVQADPVPAQRGAAERASHARQTPSIGGAGSREPVLASAPPVAAQSADAEWTLREEPGETVAEAALRDAAAEQAGTRERRRPEAGALDGATRHGHTERAQKGTEPRLGENEAVELRSEIRVSESGSGKGEGLRAGVARRAQEAFKALGKGPAPKPGSGNGRAAGTGASAGNGQHGGATMEGGSSPEDLILINVLAPREQPFTGNKLVDALRANGLRYGDMNIFHCVDKATRIHQYSVANIIEPGTFDMAAVDEFRSPGVCFFMRLPGPERPVEAFEDMHRVARDVAQRLGGELKDERRSVLTGQTVEHYRHRVAEFCRRRMSMRA